MLARVCVCVLYVCVCLCTCVCEIDREIESMCERVKEKEKKVIKELKSAIQTLERLQNCIFSVDLTQISCPGLLRFYLNFYSGNTPPYCCRSNNREGVHSHSFRCRPILEQTRAHTHTHIQVHAHANTHTCKHPHPHMHTHSLLMRACVCPISLESITLLRTLF